jgi:hypothetical protein
MQKSIRPGGPTVQSGTTLNKQHLARFYRAFADPQATRGRLGFHGARSAVMVVAELAVVSAAGIAAAVCLTVLAQRLRAGANVFESALRQPGRSTMRPAQLVRVEHVVASSRASLWDAHTRLRPLLIDVTEVRLSRRGLRLEHDRAEARRLLGATAWEFLRPDRPEPEDRQAPGIAPHELEQILDALEAL